MRQLHTMKRERPMFVKEFRLSVWWFGRPKTPLKKLLCFAIDVVILSCPPIHCHTFFTLMAFHPMELDIDRKVIDVILYDLDVVKGTLTN